MAEVVKMHGMDEVRKALRALPKEIAKRELNKALQPGANLIKNAAIAKVPTGHRSFSRMLRGKQWDHAAGQLRKSIAVRNERKKFLLDAARKRVGVLSSARDRNVGAWYWRFVEFGTSRMRARPFLIPAFEENKYTADKLIKAALLKGVQRQARRVRAR